MIREQAITEFTPSADVTIWDVRDSSAYQEGHIKYAAHQPLDSLTPSLLADTQGTVYVLCGGGTKAGKAADKLNSFDDSRDIVILTGGTRGAKAAGMKIVSEEN